MWPDRIIFFKKYQSVSNYGPTMLWWQEGYTGTKEKQKWICNNVNFLPEPDMALKSSCFGYPRATASAVTTHRARQKPLLSGKTQKAAKLWGTQTHNQAFVRASYRQSNRNNNFLDFMWLLLKTEQEGKPLNQRCFCVSTDLSGDRLLPSQHKIWNREKANTKFNFLFITFGVWLANGSW